MTNIAEFCPIEARRQAKAEVEEYRERIRLEKAAAERRNETAAAEIEREINDRRAREAEAEVVRIERQRIYDRREAALIEHRRAEAEAALIAKPELRIAATASRRAALAVRAALGDGFADFLKELWTVSPSEFVIELRRIPDDERDDVLRAEHAERQAQRDAEAIRVPEPQDEHERLILIKHNVAAAA